MFPELASTLVLRNPTLRVAHNVGQERAKRGGDAQTLTIWMDLAPADRDHKGQGLDSIMAELLPM
jgi:hypothetical protein